MSFIRYIVQGAKKDEKGRLHYTDSISGIMRSGSEEIGLVHRRHTELLPCSKLLWLEREELHEQKNHN